MRGPVRAGSLNPAAMAMLLGAVLGIVAFAVALAVAAGLFVADAIELVPALIAAGVVMAAVGAICGWAVWRTVVDRVDWPRLEAEQRLLRLGAIGRARVRARRQLDHRDG